MSASAKPTRTLRSVPVWLIAGFVARSLPPSAVELGEQHADEHTFEQEEQPLREVERIVEPEAVIRREDEVVGDEPCQRGGQRGPVQGLRSRR